MKYVRKALKRGIKAVGKSIRKRYTNKKSGGINMSRIIKDVGRLKMAINAEKKRFYITPIAESQGDFASVPPSQVAYLGGSQTTFVNNPFFVGQQYCPVALATTDGWTALDMTPYPTESNTFNGRSGASIKLCSSYIKFQFSQQSLATQQPIKFRIVIVQTMGVPQSPAVVLDNMFLTSSFPKGTGINSGDGIKDFNSDVDPDKRGQYKILINRTVKLPVNTYSTSNQIKDMSMGVKYNRGKGHHIRFNQNANSIANGQLLMFFLADSGNVGSLNYTGPGNATMPINTALTGMNVNFNICHYYYDN